MPKMQYLCWRAGINFPETLPEPWVHQWPPSPEQPPMGPLPPTLCQWPWSPSEAHPWAFAPIQSSAAGAVPAPSPAAGVFGSSERVYGHAFAWWSLDCRWGMLLPVTTLPCSPGVGEETRQERLVIQSSQGGWEQAQKSFRPWQKEAIAPFFSASPQERRLE